MGIVVTYWKAWPTPRYVSPEYARLYATLPAQRSPRAPADAKYSSPTPRTAAPPAAIQYNERRRELIGAAGSARPAAKAMGRAYTIALYFSHTATPQSAPARINRPARPPADQATAIAAATASAMKVSHCARTFMPPSFWIPGSPSSRKSMAAAGPTAPSNMPRPRPHRSHATSTAASTSAAATTDSFGQNPHISA